MDANGERRQDNAGVNACQRTRPQDQRARESAWVHKGEQTRHDAAFHTVMILVTAPWFHFALENLWLCVALHLQNSN
jgi:hypothetical protein